MKNVLLFCFALSTLVTLQAQQAPQIRNVALFLQDRVEILDFAGPMEVFIAAGLHVYTVAKTTEPIKAMGKLTVVPDYGLEDCPTPDLIAFFGGGNASGVSQDPEVKAWLAEVFPKTQMQFSVCTGAFFLGEMGLLDGKTATTFHSAIPGLRERFPKATVRDDVRYVDNGSVITTAGISAGIDGALHLVAKLQGKARALEVAEHMEYFGWEPDKGLIITSGTVDVIKKKGLKEAIAEADRQLYYGELIDLGKSLAAEGHTTSALEIFDYVLSTQTVAPNDCETIREVMQTTGRPTPPSREKVLELVNKTEYEAAAEIITRTKKDLPNWSFFTEHNANMHGYHYLSKGETQKAIEIFKLNVLAYPESFNTHDSLGEAYMKAKQWDLASKHYRRSLALNPENENGKKMLEKIGELGTKKRIME